MSDNIAVIAGFTHEIYGTSDGPDLHLLVRPEIDLGDRFMAWCCDEQEFIKVNGWLFVFEDVEV